MLCAFLSFLGLNFHKSFKKKNNLLMRETNNKISQKKIYLENVKNGELKSKINLIKFIVSRCHEICVILPHICLVLYIFICFLFVFISFVILS